MMDLQTYITHNDLSRFIRKNRLSQEGIDSFSCLIYDYYAKNKRAFPWREAHDPYHIVVSEIMLQQTQTDRVRGKYELFIKTFPTFEHLAQASVTELITVWKGLGYNRRALALQELAQRVVKEHQGILPKTPDELQSFRGIGPATAASICAFAFNSPTIFIETNIRAVYIH